MKALPLLTAVAALSLSFALPLQAADTGPTVSNPTVSERLANAREAIKAKDWRKSLAELNIAVRDEPRNADVHNLLGYSYRKQAQPNLAKAFEHYKRAIELDPNHKGAHEYIGEAYLMDKKPAEAEKHLALLEKICGGKACEEYKDLEQSLAKYKAANK
jgi:Flp pilus assembly protein TadD